MSDHPHDGGLGRRRRRLQSVRRRESEREGPVGRTITTIGHMLAEPWLFVGVLLFHAFWVILNLGALGVEPWDPPPFMLLATIASVEAPLLALLILMRQQHDARIAELREETALQVSLHSERQAALIVRLLRELQRGLDVDTAENPDRVDELAEPLDPDRLLRALEVDVEAQTGEE